MRLPIMTLMLVSVSSFAFAKDPPMVHNGGSFDFHVTEVRSIAPDEKVGFSSSLNVYAVEGYSTVTIGNWTSDPERKYVLYCTTETPDPGKTYSAEDVYISGEKSELRLWPTDKKNIGLTGKGKWFRVVIIDGVSQGKYPDVACDIYSLQATQPSKP